MVFIEKCLIFKLLKMDMVEGANYSALPPVRTHRAQFGQQAQDNLVTCLYRVSKIIDELFLQSVAGLPQRIARISPS